MKNYLIILVFISLAAYAGRDIIINTARLDGFIYGNTSGGADTLISANTDSVGQYAYQNGLDPQGPLDLVNLRTLLSAGAAGWDSIPFNPLTGDQDAWFGGTEVYTTNFDGRYVLGDSLDFVQYVDSLTIFVTPPQMMDSIFKYTDQNIFEINLPASKDVGVRIAGWDGKPDGWILTEGTSAVDLEVEHNLDRRVESVSVHAKDGSVHQMLFNTASHNGVVTDDTNNLRIQSLATINKPIVIYITFK